MLSEELDCFSFLAWHMLNHRACPGQDSFGLLCSSDTSSPSSASSDYLWSPCAFLCSSIGLLVSGLRIRKAAQLS